VLRLHLNPGDVDAATSMVTTPRALGVGEVVIGLAADRPVLTCSIATLTAGAWAIRRSEGSFPGSLWWGLGEALTVVAAFSLLGPILELRRARAGRHGVS